VTSSGFTLDVARDDDRADVLEFLREHWRRDHVFVRRPELMDWQHRTREGDLNFILARGDGAIAGLLGFIPTRHYDADVDADVFLAIWKVRDDLSGSGLGLQLLQALRRHLRPTTIAAIGLSEMVLPIYRALRYTVGLMDHHVLFNPDIDNFRIALGVPDHGRAITQDADNGADVAFVPWSEAVRADSLAHVFANSAPRKSVDYVVARYVEHPEYRYRIEVVTRSGRPQSVVVWRRVDTEGAAVLRIVDVIGDDEILGACRELFVERLRAENAEYIDVYHHGLSGAALARAGFLDRHEHPELIVPCYFEPLVRQNVELDFAVRSSAAGEVRLLRGDSDQDRPSA
jgi:hypothetical protein